MSAQDEQSHTEIEVEIGVGQVAPGGQVAGVVFGSAGSVAISTVPRAQPLDEKTIRAYLEWASQPARPAPDASEELLRLWNVGFKGHWSGAAAPQDLDQVVASVFAGTPAGSFQRLVLLASPGMGKTPALEHCLRTR
ncbi:MAG: hypothetical protein EHM56_06265, partial [Chloroflexi bacterium]